jgi:hypothetical protein
MINVYINTYAIIHVYTSTYICVYIYGEREREEWSVRGDWEKQKRKRK